MIYNVYTIFDNKVEFYMQPFFCKNTAEAIRIISDMLSNKDHQFAKYSKDFDLVHLGTYDDASASFLNFPNTIELGPLSNFVGVLERDVPLTPCTIPSSVS